MVVLGKKTKAATKSTVPATVPQKPLGIKKIPGNESPTVYEFFVDEKEN